MDNEERFLRIYDLKQQVRLRKNEIEEIEREIESLSIDILEDGGPGAAALIHDGKTIAYLGNPRRTVDKIEIEARVEELPAQVRPRIVESVKYPTVADLDKAEKVLRAAGITLGDLVTTGKPRAEFRAAEEDA